MINSYIPFTIEQLNKIFYYDKETGILIWRDKVSPGKWSGQVAGSVERQGKYVTICKREFSVASIIWKLHHGKSTRKKIFYRDGNKQNTRIENLYVKISFDKNYKRYIKLDSFFLRDILKSERGKDEGNE